MNEYNLKYIEKLRIHELRDFAKQMGISSPTTMRKEELIEKIYDLMSSDAVIMSGDKHAPKESLDFFSLLTSPNSNLLDELMIKTSKNDHKNTKANENGEISNTLIMKKSSLVNANTPYAYSTNDFIGLNFNVRQNEMQYDKDIYESEGYVDIHPNGYGIVRNNGFIPNSNDSYLTLALVKKHGLKKGEYVRGKVRTVLEDKPMVMFEILSIDGNPSGQNEINFDNCSFKKCGDTFYLDKFKLNIRKGERVYLKNMNIDDVVKLGYDIVDENKSSVKLLNIKSMPEEQYASHQKLQIVNCPFNVSEEDLVSTIELVLERIKREFECNKSNILILYNFCEMIRQFNIAINGVYDFGKFSAKAVNQVSNILYNAKYFDENKHVTIICVDKNGICDDVKMVMETAFIPLFNQIIDMKEN